MFPTNPTFESDIRREEMLREAQKQQLIREAQQAKNESNLSFERWLRTFAAALFLVHPR